jgi:hypothetical protein
MGPPDQRSATASGRPGVDVRGTADTGAAAGDVRDVGPGQQTERRDDDAAGAARAADGYGYGYGSTASASLSASRRWIPSLS